MKAVWNGHVIAESNETVFIEGNQYFPPETLDRSFVENSDFTTECFWKGTAHYYHLVDGETKVENAVWYYPEPKEGSEQKVGHDYKEYVAFYKDKVTISE